MPTKNVQRTGKSPARGRQPGGQEPQRRAGGRLSQTAENYLLSLQILQEDGIAPHISRLAEFLRHIPLEEGMGTTMASVSGMIQRMSKDGLLYLNKEKEIVLTDGGQRMAYDIVRRHRLAERLLVDLLNVPLERAETEAHQLEHSISPSVLIRIEEKLGYPETCPYGRPIYRAGEVNPRPDPPDTIRLSEAVSGTEYQVLLIPDEDLALLEYLVDHKILPKAVVRVSEVALYRGVVDLDRSGEKLSISISVASRIRVQPTHHGQDGA